MSVAMLLLLQAAVVGTTFAGSSEGVQPEYIAVFLAVLFPGALVAFNHELLLALPRFSTLRVYCAGIWHNAAFCGACAFALFLLPLALYPFYIHGENLMVLEVSSASPLSPYLSPRDVIVSLDGIRIHDLQDWREIIALLNEEARQDSNSLRHPIKVNSRKSYCVPYSLIEESTQIDLQGNETTCPNELFAFYEVSCLDSSTDDGSPYSKHQKRSENIHCLDAKDVVKLEKCSDGSVGGHQNNRSCLCSEGHSCFAPVKTPGLTWVEITVLSSSSPKCWVLMRNSSLEDSEPYFGEMSCLHTFVFAGDVNSIAESLHVSSCQPRWSHDFGLYLPSMLEKLLFCSFQVSLTFALLNSLPVYFLDGESILEVLLHYLSLLSPRKRGTVLRCCLLGGTVSCMLAFFWILLDIL